MSGTRGAVRRIGLVMASGRTRTTLVVGAMPVAMAPMLRAQAATRTVVVRDDLGARVPHAVVAERGGAPVIADDSGRASVRVVAGQALDPWVRRIGYREFVGVVMPSGEGGRYEVTLRPLARNLETVVVEERADTPLARTGFYDRVDRARSGAFAVEFITPEELDQLTATQTSDPFQGRRAARVRRSIGGRNLILGRGDCAMTILIDKQRVNKSAQDIAVAGSAQSPPGLDGQPRKPDGLPASSKFMSQEAAERSLPSLDELVGSCEIMAIEIYASLANAPAELIPLTGGGSCGLIAIWTGARR